MNCRLPVPGVNIEWEREGRFYGLTVFSMPSTVTLPGAQADHAWTLGGTHTGRRLDILNLSGMVAFANRKDEVYGGQNRAMPYPGGGYLTFRPGDTLEKMLAIDYGRIPAEGRGFRRLVRAGWELLRPVPKPALTRKETIALKTERASLPLAGGKGDRRLHLDPGYVGGGKRLQRQPRIPFRLGRAVAPAGLVRPRNRRPRPG